MKDMYTPLDEAAEILDDRRQDPELFKKVSEYLGGILPTEIAEGKAPTALLMRYVARGTKEDLLYARVATENGMNPYWASYEADAFTNRNPEKVETIRPPLLWAKGQRTRGWVVDVDNRTGGVGKLVTKYGTTVSEYQAGIRAVVFADQEIEACTANVYDMSDWYKKQAVRFGYESGRLAPYYYRATMGWLTLNAWFEDLDGGPNAGGGDLDEFRNAVVVPAFEQAEEATGLRPIIVRLPYETGMGDTDLSFLDAEQTQSLQKYGRIEVIS